MVLIQSSPLPKIVFTSLFVCVYRVFGENAVCYNSDSLYVGNCAPVRKWWNWQTHHLEGVAPKGVGVQIPPSAPSHSSSTRNFELRLRRSFLHVANGSDHD